MRKKIYEIPYRALTQQETHDLINNLKNDTLKFYQFYNTDFSPQEFSFYKYLENFGEIDSKFWDKKILNKSYYDIETLYDPKKAPDPINTPFPITAVAVYNNIKNIAYIYFLQESGNTLHNISEEKFSEEVNNMYNEIVHENELYKVPGINIQVKLFKKEEKLLESFFEDILDMGTLFLIGFNSMIFDDPYTINRLTKLIGREKADNIISMFILKRFGQYNFEQPEYIRVDLLKYYKPVDQGGMGMGKSLPSYKLDVIAEEELKINKLDLEGDFNEVYRNNPIRFATYNLLDVILPYKLDVKLEFLEQLYSLAKYNNSSVRGTMMGRSFIFTYRNNYHYSHEKDILIRQNKFNKETYYSVNME